MWACAEPELLRGLLAAIEPHTEAVFICAPIPALPLRWPLDEAHAQGLEDEGKLTQRDQDLLQELKLKLPSHVHAVEFAPQNDLLAHTNLKLFISQLGGRKELSVSCPGHRMSLLIERREWCRACQQLLVAC